MPCKDLEGKKTQTRWAHFENQSNENWYITINPLHQIVHPSFHQSLTETEALTNQGRFLSNFAYIKRNNTTTHCSDCFLILFDVCGYFSNPHGKSPQIKILWNMKKVQRKFTQFILNFPTRTNRKSEQNSAISWTEYIFKPWKESSFATLNNKYLVIFASTTF